MKTQNVYYSRHQCATGDRKKTVTCLMLNKNKSAMQKLYIYVAYRTTRAADNMKYILARGTS